MRGIFDDRFLISCMRRLFNSDIVARLDHHFPVCAFSLWTPVNLFECESHCHLPAVGTTDVFMILAYYLSLMHETKPIVTKGIRSYCHAVFLMFLSFLPVGLPCT